MKCDLTLEAELELDKALCYFKPIGKSQSFFEDFLKQIEIISLMPEAFQIKYNETRIINFSNFDYSIHYTLESTRILVLNILNRKQDF